MIKDRNEFYDDIVVNLSSRQKQDLEQHNRKREIPPKLLENQEIYVKSPGIKSKIKDKFNVLKVKENKEDVKRKVE